MKTLAKKKNLIIIITLLLIGGIFITNALGYLAAKNTLRENIINSSLPLTRDNIYTEIQRDLMQPIYVASMMSNDTFLKEWIINGEKDEVSVQRYLGEIKHKYNFFTSFFISDKTKTYYYHGGKLKTISKSDNHDQWYFKFLDKHIPYELTVDTNEAANYALTIFINHRVYDFHNNLVGVAGVGLDLERITNMLSAYRVKYNRDIYLVDHHGLIKAHHNKSYVETTNILFMDGIKDVAEGILAVSQNSENFEFDRDGKHILLTKRFIPELDWFLVVEQNQDAAIENIWSNFLKSSFIGLFVSVLILMVIISSVNYYNRRLEKLAITDELTGAYNRREFSRRFEDAVQAYRKNENPFTVLLIDIDNFKSINDMFGHSIGDEVIRFVTLECGRHIREDDLLARWGGDEFILMISGDTKTAVNIIERIYSNIRANKDSYSPEFTRLDITLSTGISQYVHGDSEDSLTIRADRALYHAKQTGRNRFTIFENMQ
jgi:diguanylate cyclase (GGDEF)-like protein